MAFAEETVTAALQPYGHCRLRYDTAGTPVTVGRVLSVGAINVEPEYLSISGFSATGLEQIMHRYWVARGTGEFDITVDVFTDIDSTAFLNTLKADWDLVQLYPRNPTKGWRLVIPFGTLIPLAVQPNRKEVSVQTFRMLPSHSTAGTPPWTFDADYTV